MPLEPPTRTPSEADIVQNSAGSAGDVEVILRENGWLAGTTPPEIAGWIADAAALLGPHATDRTSLVALLKLIFEYDAAAILRSSEAHSLLARAGARKVIRELANQVLEGGAVDSDRFKGLIEALKSRVPWRSRDLFHPIRLALAGRAGEGELDRVILLCDAAAQLPFAVPVKSVRQRLLEFCAALD